MSDDQALKKFNAELETLFDSKNLSKNKIQDITKAAIKAQKHYKHVVYGCEKLMHKATKEQRLSVLYVVDSIVRAAKHQLKTDCYSTRFIRQFGKFFDALMKCSSKDKLKLVRTLNLWSANRVFKEADIQPYRERCKMAGLKIDFEEVEKAVKGPNADMSIYSGNYKKRSKGKTMRSTTPPLPLPDDGLLGAGPSFKAGPDIPTFVLSEEIVNGTISEREMLEMIQKFQIDKAGVLSKNRELLQKVLQVFVESLSRNVAEVEAEKNKKNGTNIQNVLTKDFEYSDDEEEKEEQEEPKKEVKRLNHDEILTLANSLINQPAVLSKITEVFTPAVNPFGVPIVSEASVPTTAASLAPSQNLLAIAPGFVNQHLANLANLPGINAAQLLNPQNAQAANLLRAAQMQALQGQMGAAAAANQQRNLMMLGNPLMNPFALAANPALLNELAAAQAALLANEPPLEGSPEKKMAESQEMEKAKLKEKEKETRERKKMGLPAVRPGFTTIASCSLMLKKLPANAVESDVKQSLESAGEASRIKVINNRACAFVTMESRRAANEVVQKLREVTVAKKMVKVYWARSPAMDQDQYTKFWDSNRGVMEIPYDQLPTDLAAFCEGGWLDVESLPIEKRSMYKGTGEIIIAAPPPTTMQQPPVPQPPPLGFPFHPQLGQLPGPPLPGPPRPPGLPPGVPPMFQLNLNAPPPPGMPQIPGFPPAPPPPGVGPPPQSGPPMGFDPNKPPPMFQQGFNPNAPPPPFGNRGGPPLPQIPPPGFPPQRQGPPPPQMHHGPLPPAFRGGPPPPQSLFDSTRRGVNGGPPPPLFRPENGRGRGGLPDQQEMWNREREHQRRDGGRDRDFDRDRSQIDRRRGDDGPRRRSRWGDDDRQEERRDDRRDDRRDRRRSSRSPERRPRRSPSYERDRESSAKKSNILAEEAMVSSTTIDEQKEPPVAPVESGDTNEVAPEPEPVKPPSQLPDIAGAIESFHEDQTDEVPMDLE